MAHVPTNHDRGDAADAMRSKGARIARLRRRLSELDPREDALVSILKGVLDLLEDKL